MIGQGIVVLRVGETYSYALTYLQQVCSASPTKPKGIQQDLGTADRCRALPFSLRFKPIFAPKICRFRMLRLGGECTFLLPALLYNLQLPFLKLYHVGLADAEENVQDLRLCTVPDHIVLSASRITFSTLPLL